MRASGCLSLVTGYAFVRAIAPGRAVAGGRFAAALGAAATGVLVLDLALTCRSPCSRRLPMRVSRAA